MTKLRLTQTQFDTLSWLYAATRDCPIADSDNRPPGVSKSVWCGRIALLVQVGAIISTIKYTGRVAERHVTFLATPADCYVTSAAEIIAVRAAERAEKAAKPVDPDGEPGVCSGDRAACDELLARLRERWPKGAPGEMNLKPAAPWRPGFHGVEARAL